MHEDGRGSSASFQDAECGTVDRDQYENAAFPMSKRPEAKRNPVRMA